MKRPYPWKCPHCREFRFKPIVADYAADIEHDGRVYRTVVKNLDFLRCENCGTQQLPDSTQERLFQELRLQAGLLTPEQIAEKRKRLGLNQKAFAQLLGVAKETVCRWESGGQIQQRVMNNFMQTFFAVRQARDYLKKLRVPSSR